MNKIITTYSVIRKTYTWALNIFYVFTLPLALIAACASYSLQAQEQTVTGITKPVDDKTEKFINELTVKPNGKVFIHEFNQRVIIDGIDNKLYNSISIKIFKKNTNGELLAVDKLDARAKSLISVDLSKYLESGDYLIKTELYSATSYLPVKTHSTEFILIDKEVLTFSDNSLAVRFASKRGDYRSQTDIWDTSFNTTPNEIGILYKKNFDRNFLKMSFDMEDFIAKGKLFNNNQLTLNYIFEFATYSNYHFFYGPEVRAKMINLITNTIDDSVESKSISIFDLGLQIAMENRINKKIIIFSNLSVLPVYFNDSSSVDTNYTFSAGLEFFIEFPFSIFFNLRLENFNYENTKEDTQVSYTSNGVDIGLRYSF